MSPRPHSTDSLHSPRATPSDAGGGCHAGEHHGGGVGYGHGLGAVHKATSELGVHDHICLVYETEEELLAGTVAYMQEGLQRGERCIYTATETPVDVATEAMTKAGVDVEAAVRAGDLTVVTEHETYLKQGHFDPDWMIGFLQERAEETEELGYKALRVTGGVTWALSDSVGADLLLEYESKVNSFFETHNASGLCQYDRNRYSPEVIMGLLHTHPRVIYKDIVCRNFYYVPPEELLGKRQGQQRVERLLGNILERERVEDELRRLNEDLERRVAERTADLEQANRELESFAYTVSHDLRAPLRGIRTLSQIVDEDYADRLDAQGRTYLARLQTESQRMARLVDDLLRMSRASTAELRREPVDLSRVAAAIVGRLQRGAPERSAEVAIADGLTARADPQLLQAALENLLGNAWKYTANEPVARIAFGEAASRGAPVFFVRDNGVGFNPTKASGLFEPFERLHGGEFEGTGVGLATVRRIVERHGGRVWAHSEGPGHGATFYFTLGK